MNLLFIVEKPHFKKWFEQEFAKHRDILNYTIDVACTTAIVISDEVAERFHFNTDGFERFSMKSRVVPSNFKIYRDYLPNHRDESLSKIQSGNYDYLVNACGPCGPGHDEAGDLMFDYTRERCGVLDVPTLRFDMSALFWEMEPVEVFKQIEDQLAALSKEE